MLAVADISLNKDVPRIVTNRIERIEVAGIGELIKVDDTFDIRTRIGQDLPNITAADESRAAGDK